MEMPMILDEQMRWWLSPLSGANSHQLDMWVLWHARLMVLAWAVLLPLGAVAARYFKVTPQQDWPRHVDNRAWWHGHRALQYGGVVIMLVGTAIVWNARTESDAPPSIALWHGYLGWTVVALGALQILSAWFRGSKGGPTDVQLRGDHYDMTHHRLWFEAVHKSGGWLSVVLAVVTIALGLAAADAPRWMPLALVLWWTGLLAASFYLERTGHCIDTYQAIWGPDIKHPGNQRNISGWGMRRPAVTSSDRKRS